MKYVFLFCGTGSDQAASDPITADELKQRYAQVGHWFAANRARLGHGYELQGPDTATTVRFDGKGKAIVKDGLFLEGKEMVGGYTEVDVPDLDTALALARTWPGGGTVEIRPVVEEG